MTAAEIFNTVQNKLPDLKIQLQQGQAGDPWILVDPENLFKLIRFLKEEVGMNYLACLSGIDYESSLGVVYQLRSLTDKNEVMVKTLTSRDNPRVPSLTNLYAGAGWLEREAYDLVGIIFQDHPDLRRIMLPDDWPGHPLRKDYQPPAEYHGIPCERPSTHDLLDQLHANKNTGNIGNPGSDPETRTRPSVSEQKSPPAGKGNQP